MGIVAVLHETGSSFIMKKHVWDGPEAGEDVAPERNLLFEQTPQICVFTLRRSKVTRPVCLWLFILPDLLILNQKIKSESVI